MGSATSGQGGKGSKRRPSFVGEDELDLRYKLAFGKITLEQFNKELAIIKERKKK